MPKLLGTLTLVIEFFTPTTMRTLLILLTAVLLTTTANAQFYEGWPCKIKSQITPMDMGMVKQGTIEKVAYPFINDGTEPLIISSYKGGTADLKIILPEGAIKPGRKAMITVEFHAKTSGKFREQIELKTSCQKKPVVLEFFGKVGN